MHSAKLIITEKSACVRASKTELDWLVGMSQGGFWVLIRIDCWAGLARDEYIGFEVSYGPT
jgi:hypothetical protein